MKLNLLQTFETPSGNPKIFNFLQIRPIVHTEETHDINLDHIKKEDTIIYSESNILEMAFLKEYMIWFMSDLNLLTP